MCSHCTHTIKAAWTGVPTTLARNKRLFNLVSNNKELLEKLSTMAQRDIDNVVRTWQRDPELMMQVLQTMTGKPLLTADKNTDLLNKFKDNIGQAYRLGLDAAPGTPQLIPRMIEESVKDNVFKFVTRLDDDTRRELGTKLSDIIEHNRTAPQIEKLMPRDVAQELSKVLDGNVSRAEAIARTETMRSANLASWSQAKAMGATHYTVDSSFEACEECSETYDGEVYPIDDTDNLPPLHPNCACVPLFGSEEEMMADADELSQRNEDEVSDLAEMGMEPASDGSGPVEIDENSKEEINNDPFAGLPDYELSQLKWDAEDFMGPEGRNVIMDRYYFKDLDLELRIPQGYDINELRYGPKEIIAAYERLPENVQNIVTHIESYPTPLYSDKNCMGGYMMNQISFFSHPGETQYTIDYILRHEGAHQIDQFPLHLSDKLETMFSKADLGKLGQGRGVSSTNYYSKALREDTKLTGNKWVSDYAARTRSKTEDFADAAAKYIENPKSFASEFPNRAAVLKEIL